MSSTNLDYDIDDEDDDLFEDATEGDMDQDEDQSVEVETEEAEEEAPSAMAVDEDDDEDNENDNENDNDNDNYNDNENENGNENDINSSLLATVADDDLIVNGLNNQNDNQVSATTNGDTGDSEAVKLVEESHRSEHSPSAGVRVGNSGLANDPGDGQGEGVVDTREEETNGSKRTFLTFKDKYPIEPSADLLQCSSYDVIPYVAALHGCHVHSMAFSWGLKYMFTGGQDGFIRKYNFMDSVNGKLPLTVAQRHQFVDSITKSGVLTSYWENEQPPFQKSARTGSDGLYEPKVSPVYSLAVQSEGLWLLAGLESGGINLQTVRHNEGQIHAYLDKHTSAVSCLRLDDTETRALSGSWDRTVIEWDLNTGLPIHQYVGASGQISSVEWQPKGGAIVTDALREEVEKRKNKNERNPIAKSSNGEKINIKNEQNGVDVGQANIENGLTGNNGDDDEDDRKSLGSLFGDDDEDEEMKKTGDDDDGDVVARASPDNDRNNTNADVNDLSNSKVDITNGENKNDDKISLSGSGHISEQPTEESRSNRSGEKYSAGETVDSGYSVFMSSCIDGTIDIWDRRQARKAAHIPVPDSTPPWCMSACWSTDGNFIFAGRRNSTVDEFDIRSSLVSPSRTFKFPSVSGVVSSVSALPNNRHLLCGSHDNIRLYDLQASMGKNKVPFYIIPGHHGAVISSMYVDPGCNYMVSSSGSRGWQGNSMDVALVYEIRPM